MTTRTSTKLTDTLLTVGATLRLTRLVTEDSLGQWFAIVPAELWAMEHDGEKPSDDDPELVQLDPTKGWRSKLVSGLSCPACVGFWIGAAVVGTYTVAKRSETGLRAWRTAASTLALNVATVELSRRL